MCLPDFDRLHSRCARVDERGGRERIGDGGRRRCTHFEQRFLPHERIAEVLYLTGIEEGEDTHLAHERDEILGVEQQALVAAMEGERSRYTRPYRPGVDDA